MYRISAVLLILLVAQGAPAAELTVRPALTFSLPFGGHNADTGTSVAVDSSGNAYVTGTTTSTDFPVKNGFQQQLLSAPAHSSSDQGKTWLTPAIPAPLYAVAASPKAPLVLFAGTSQGMYKSSDGGNTWITLANFDSTLLVQAVVADATNPSIVYAGSSGGTFKSTDAGMSWKLVDSGQYVSILVANPVLPTILFSVTFNESGNMYRSTDSGITWSLLPNAPAPFAVACDAVNPDVLYAAAFDQTGAAAVYQTSDGGNTWTQLAVLPVADSTFALAASPTTIYAATDNGVMISRDAGVTWTATSITAAADNVAVDPNHPNVAYSNAGGIFMTADSGTTWTEVLPIRMYVQTISVVSTLSIVFVGAAPGQGAFVTKWSADGKQMLYSTFLAGSYDDFPTGIAVDAEGNAYVTGYTYSTDFPVTSGAIQTRNSSQISAFVAKISPDGSQLLYSTYLSGSGQDGAYGIAVDDAGNAYIAGFAGSANFPVTPNASQPTIDQGCEPVSTASFSPLILGDAFVAKIDTSASVLRYSTFLGGSCADQASGIAIDSAGNAYVVGSTMSSDFPITAGALNSELGNGGASGFLTKFTPQGSRSYSTFIGGSGYDSANGVALDSAGNIFITGSTFGFDQYLALEQSAEYVITSSFLLPQVFAPGFFVSTGGAAYALKIDGSTMSRKFVTYLGGRFGSGSSIAVDSSGKVWVAGLTQALTFNQPAQFPLVHPFQADTGTGFVSQISSDGSTILFSSLIDSAGGLALDPSGNAFVAGTTYLSNLSLYSSPFLARIDGAVPSAVTLEAPQRLVPQTAGFYPIPGIAPGEIVVLTGTGLGPAQEVDAPSTAQLGKSLGGTSVTFGGSAAPLLSVQSEKVVCIAPFELQTDATIQVTSGSAVSNSIRLPATDTEVEILSVVNADGGLNTADHPAAVGTTVTVFAAGFGDTNPPSMDGQINGSGTLLVSPVVHIARQDAQIVYAGPAPGQVAGMSEISFIVPPLRAGHYTIYVGSGLFYSYSDFNSTIINVGQP